MAENKFIVKDIIILVSNMETVQQEDFKTFAERFQLAYKIQKRDRGVIFIGNSRAGKTTLSVAASGSRIIIKHNKSCQLTSLHPMDSPYVNLVKDTNSSVTKTPNFFQLNNLAIIDMPGYADSSRFQQFLNYHYIKKTINNIKQIRFVIVVTLSYSGGKYQLEQKQKKMLQNFVDNFQDCISNFHDWRDCIHIIINRVQISNEASKVKEKNSIKEAFKNLLLHQSPKILRFFQSISCERIQVIFMPIYKQNKDMNDWDEQYPQINQVMRSICLDNQAKYVKISNYNKKIQIFKDVGDTQANSNFRDLLFQYLEEQKKGTANVKDAFQFIFIKLIVGLVSKTINQQELQIEKILTDFQSKDKTQQYKNHQQLINIDSYNTKYTLNQSKIINLLNTFFDGKIKQKKNSSEANMLEVIHSIFGQLQWITSSLYSDNKNLKKRMNYLHVYTVSRLKQTFLIYQSIKDQKMLDLSKLQDKINQEVFQNINDLNKFQKYKVIFENSLQKIFESVLQVNIKIRFGTNFNQATRKELLSILQIMGDIYKKRIITKQQKLINSSIQKINKKIKQIQLYSIIIHKPNRPEEIKKFIEQLLQKYVTAQTTECKNIIALKLAANLEKKQKKLAIALYFHTQIYEEALRLVESLLVPTINQSKNKETTLNWFLALAQEFRIRNKAYFYQRCLQKAKTLCLQDYQKLTDIKKRLKQGLTAINKASLKNNTLQEQKRLELEMDQQISFLRALHKLEVRKKEYKVIGERLRQ